MGIKKIAKLAGVSISTVSRVLNGTKPVSPDLERRVRAVIEQEDYVPNHSARSMVLQKTNLIGLILPRMSGFFHQKLFYLLESFLEERGYKLLVCNIKDNDVSEISYLNLLRQKEVDGIVLCHESHSVKTRDHLEKSRIPVVQCAIHIPGLKWPAVHTDAEQAARDAVEYLIRKGHRKIGMICAERYNSADFQVRGYHSALGAHGIEADRRLIHPGGFSLESGKEVTGLLLDQNPDMTAIFYVSDEMALGGYRALSDRGLTPGRDMAIMGHDGIELSRYVNPTLTTIYQPIDEMAEHTVELLLSLVEAGPPEDTPLEELSRVFPHRIIEGTSCS